MPQLQHTLLEGWLLLFTSTHNAKCLELPKDPLPAAEFTGAHTHIYKGTPRAIQGDSFLVAKLLAQGPRGLDHCKVSLPLRCSVWGQRISL